MTVNAEGIWFGETTSKMGRVFKFPSFRHQSRANTTGETISKWNASHQALSGIIVSPEVAELLYGNEIELLSIDANNARALSSRYEELLAGSVTNLVATAGERALTSIGDTVTIKGSPQDWAAIIVSANEPALEPQSLTGFLTADNSLDNSVRQISSIDSLIAVAARVLSEGGFEEGYENEYSTAIEGMAQDYFAVNKLLRMIRQDSAISPEVVAATMKYLSQSAILSARSAVLRTAIALLSSSSEVVRDASTIAIFEIGDPAAAASLEQALRHESNPTIRQNMTETLEYLSRSE